MGRILSRLYLGDETQGTAFVSGDTEESYLARIQIRKVLLYSRIAQLIALAAAPVCFFMYAGPERFLLSAALALTGIVPFLLYPLLSRRTWSTGWSDVTPLIMTVVFLIPAAIGTIQYPVEEQGRGIIFVALGASAWYVSTRWLWAHFAACLAAWGIAWHQSGLIVGPDDVILFLGVTPVVAFLMCSVNIRSLKQTFQHQLEAERKQQELMQTLGKLTEETNLRREEEELRHAGEKRLESQHEQLLHVSRLSAMGEMVAGISHELQQPLHSMAMYAGILDTIAERSEGADAESIRIYSGKVVQLTQQNAAVIRRLQNFVRRGTSNRERVNMRQLILDAVELTNVELQRRKVRVETDLAAADCKLSVDPVQIQQVLVNLLKNACDAMSDVSRDGRRISLAAERQEGMLQVHVRDFGAGLRRIDSERLFDTFYSTKVDGLGMGLAISRSIMEDHDGRVGLTENSDGQGVTATIELPLNEPATELTNVEQPYGLSGRR